MTVFDLLGRLAELGCEVKTEGEKLLVRGPDRPEIPPLISELRASRDEALAILREAENKPPTLDEVKAALPPGVRVISYQPKQPPFAVAPVSVVTNAGKFYRAYLADLGRRLAKPEGYHAPPLADIVSKLADAGLELEIEDVKIKPGGLQ